MQNNFDISEIYITNIHTVYSAELKVHTEAESISEHDLIVIKLTGESVYTIDEKDYAANEGNILFIPSGASYSLFVKKSGACIIIEFDTKQAGTKTCVRSFFTDGDSELISAAKSIARFWDLGGPAYKSKCLSELYGIITQISVIDSYTNTLAEKYRMIHRSVKYIEENYRQKDLYTPLLAEMSGIRDTYYRNIFFDVFKCSPNKYITNLRIKRAKELLAVDSVSLDEVAKATGFANSSYLCKVFKSTTGETPAAYAKKAKCLG